MNAYDKLKKKWTLCEFGIKTRVFKIIPQQQIDYILKHPEYQNKDKIKEVIKVIDKVSKEILLEVTEMNNNIKNITVKDHKVIK